MKELWATENDSAGMSYSQYLTVSQLTSRWWPHQDSAWRTKTQEAPEDRFLFLSIRFTARMWSQQVKRRQFRSSRSKRFIGGASWLSHSPMNTVHRMLGTGEMYLSGHWRLTWLRMSRPPARMEESSDNLLVVHIRIVWSMGRQPGWGKLGMGPGNKNIGGISDLRYKSHNKGLNIITSYPDIWGSY